MKPVLIILITTAAILVSGILTQQMLYSESDRLHNSLCTLEDYIISQNWEEAEKTLEKFHKNWDKISRTWAMLVDHYEIDNIELELSQLSSFINSKDKSLSLSRLSALKTLVKHIPKKESFILENIL
jgi:hypothetical protein